MLLIEKNIQKQDDNSTSSNSENEFKELDNEIGKVVRGETSFEEEKLNGINGEDSNQKNKKNTLKYEENNINNSNLNQKEDLHQANILNYLYQTQQLNLLALEEYKKNLIISLINSENNINFNIYNSNNLNNINNNINNSSQNNFSNTINNVFFNNQMKNINHSNINDLYLNELTSLYESYYNYCNNNTNLSNYIIKNNCIYNNVNNFCLNNSILKLENNNLLKYNLLKNLNRNNTCNNRLNIFACLYNNNLNNNYINNRNLNDSSISNNEINHKFIINQINSNLNNNQEGSQINLNNLNINDINIKNQNRMINDILNNNQNLTNKLKINENEKEKNNKNKFKKKKFLNQKGEKEIQSNNVINLMEIFLLKDKRTTLMIKNIPNKYTISSFLEEINVFFKYTYDIFYLPIDYVNKCNLGFAFINFVEPFHIILFYELYRGKKWKKFNSDKICELLYAKFQGKKELIAHFEKGKVLSMDSEEKRPLILPTPNPLPKINLPYYYCNLFMIIYPNIPFEIKDCKNKKNNNGKNINSSLLPFISFKGNCLKNRK